MTDSQMLSKMSQLIMDLIIQSVEVSRNSNDPYVKAEMKKMNDKLGAYLNDRV